jgi:hypothetical protein
MTQTIKIASFVALLFFSTFLNAQDNDVYARNDQPQKSKKPFAERLFLSPDLGLQFGTVTVVNVSPKIGYRITDKFAAGLGGTYIYIKDKTFKQLGYIYESSIYGGSIFSQYQIFEQIRLYSEYELLSLETFNSKTFKTTRELVPSLLAGGGYISRIGGNSSFNIMLLYNLLDGPNSIYDNPVIRIGFNIGL